MSINWTTIFFVSRYSCTLMEGNLLSWRTKEHLWSSSSVSSIQIPKRGSLLRRLSSTPLSQWPTWRLRGSPAFSKRLCVTIGWIDRFVFRLIHWLIVVFSSVRTGPFTKCWSVQWIAQERNFLLMMRLVQSLQSNLAASGVENSRSSNSSHAVCRHDENNKSLTSKRNSSVAVFDETWFRTGVGPRVLHGGFLLVLTLRIGQMQRTNWTYWMHILYIIFFVWGVVSSECMFCPVWVDVSWDQLQPHATLIRIGDGKWMDWWTVYSSDQPSDCPCEELLCMGGWWWSDSPSTCG